MSAKDARDVERWAVKRGWKVQQTPGGHMRYTKPGCAVVHMAATPGRGRAVANMKGLLRRAERQGRGGRR